MDWRCTLCGNMSCNGKCFLILNRIYFEERERERERIGIMCAKIKIDYDTNAIPILQTKKPSGLATPSCSNQNDG